MKKGRAQTVKGSPKRRASPRCVGVKKSITKSTVQVKNIPEKNVEVLHGSAARPSTHHLAEQACLPQSVSIVPTDELTSDRLHPSTKVKLQLFPINEDTRIQLEKDGYNPFLELTLRARKKISSVIKHMNTKWGSSTVANGELIVVPYSTPLEKLASEKRWTLNDISITARDVYAAINSPAVFRLSYGWLSNLEPKMPFQSSFLEACLGSEGISKDYFHNSEISPDSLKALETTSEDLVKPNHVDRAAAENVTEQFMDVPANHWDGKEKMDNIIEQSILPWNDTIGQSIDSLLNLSIGGFISELSLLGKANECSLKSTQSQEGLQQIQLTSDISVSRLLNEASLQGKISNHKSASYSSKSAVPVHEDVGDGLHFSWDDSVFNLSIGGLLSEASLQEKIHAQPEKSLARESHSSILDAEETCHAFSFQKFQSTKGYPTLSETGRHGSSSSHCANSNSTKVSPNPELKNQDGLIQDPPCKESKTDYQLGSRILGEDGCTGLTGIKWNDSLGPFDMGISSFPPIFGGDSTSFSKLIQ